MNKEDFGQYAWKPPTKETPQRSVLIAEDDRATLNLYRMGLKGLQGFRVLLAENGMKALEVLQNQPVDVLVTDLSMPVLDGFKLIAIVAERYPSVPVLVMTGLPEVEHQNAPLFLGALRILSKPPRLSQLREEIRAAAQRRPDGLVRGIALGSLLQLMSWERKSCTMTVHGPSGIGHLYVKDGELIHAAFHDLEPLESAYTILNWSRPEVEFVDTCRVERTLDMPMTEIVLNAAMIQDLDNRQE
ncbi:MAG: response regulator [Acidobacteria bacterium]|nr:response regulator [Acidobacteriota bacterium]